jgi:hypothetical protein
MIEVRDISMKCDDISQQKNLFFFFFFNSSTKKSITTNKKTGIQKRDKTECRLPHSLLLPSTASKHVPSLDPKKIIYNKLFIPNLLYKMLKNNINHVLTSLLIV